MSAPQYECLIPDHLPEVGQLTEGRPIVFRCSGQLEEAAVEGVDEGEVVGLEAPLAGVAAPGDVATVVGLDARGVRFVQATVEDARLKGL